MSIIKETTVHEMKTNFSQYSADLLNGTYDEIIVKNRTVPTLRILRFDDSPEPGLEFGVSQRLGHLVVSDSWEMNDGDDEIASLFEKASR